MATVTRRDAFGIDMPRWFTRFLEERPMRDWILEPVFDSQIRLEEFDEDGAHVIRAELPGLDPEKDVEISVHDGMLHIKAERTRSEEAKDKTFYRSEFSYGAFERAVPLPAGATAQDVEATYQDGILQIRIPVVTEAPVTKVPVQRI